MIPEMEVYDATKNYDKMLHVRFDLHPVLQQEESDKEGRPIYRDVEYIEIISPGDPKSVVHRPAHQGDKHRFREQYQAFKDGNSDAVQGTPLSAWGVVTKAQVQELAFFRIKTVEQLANVNDSAIQNVGPIRSLREAARDFVERTKSNGPFLQLQAQAEKQQGEIDLLRREAEKARRQQIEIDSLRAQIAEQSKQLAEREKKAR